MFNSKLDQRIGIIGGGQLGKMMILEAKKLGFTVSILDPSPDCPAHSIADNHIIAPFEDADAIKKLSQVSDVLTYEFEHINADALIALEQEQVKIYPSPESLKLIQNKLTQKQALKRNRIPVPEFVGVHSVQELKETCEAMGFPLLLKTCIGGYDGKGNFVIKDENSITEGYGMLGGGKMPLMAEKYVNFDMEVSVLACRGIDGDIKVFPVGKNTHIDNILDETLVPAPISHNTTAAAMNVARQVLDLFKGVGIFCIEMFVTKSGDILVNEVAPRPHNSGHYTIEACVTSQFEQHIRAITGLPLGDSSLVRPAAMRNILGKRGHSGPAEVCGVWEALNIEGSKLHIYGKTMVKPGRKMGHITVTAQTAAEASLLCLKAKERIKIISMEAL